MYKIMNAMTGKRKKALLYSMQEHVNSVFNNFESEDAVLHTIFHLGFKDDNYQANIHSLGYTVWFDKDSHYPYALIQDRLSKAFFSAELVSKTGYNQPYLINVFVSFKSIGIFKDGDTETSLDRIKHWILQMERPSVPLIVKFYLYNHDYAQHFGNTDHFTTLWPLRTNSKETHNFITINHYENYNDPYDGKFKYTRNNDGYAIYDAIIAEANRRNIGVKVLNYSTPFAEVIGHLHSSRAHFSYFGSTYYIAEALGQKSYIFGYGYPEKRKPINYEHGSYLPSPWAGEKVLHIDTISRELTNKPVTTFSYIDSVEHVKEIFDNGLKNVTH